MKKWGFLYCTKYVRGFICHFQKRSKIIQEKDVQFLKVKHMKK
ncbi:hypothetical protein BAWI5_21435 [Bacillus wiedmannii]